MQSKHETYTYTARNANNPEKVVTFTLYDGHMRINLTGLLDQASSISQTDEKSDQLKQELTTQAKPAAVKLMENISEPVHVSDVQTSLSDDDLQVTLWKRLGGLRLAPVVFNMGAVDNQEAAEAFTQELKKRQKEESYAGKFFGPLDYWFGWIGLILLIGLLIRWPQKETA
jgi:hypothetical protein